MHFAKQASRSTLREFMSDTIDEEVDKYTAEKAEEAAFHNDRVIKYNDPEYRPPGYENVKPLSDSEH